MVWTLIFNDEKMYYVKIELDIKEIKKWQYIYQLAHEYKNINIDSLDISLLNRKLAERENHDSSIMRF